jgi:hypothetical protein
MGKRAQRKLKDRILEEMTTEYTNVLEKNFETARRFIRVTPEGKVDVLLKGKLTGKENIQLYLIGKLYAKVAGLAPSEDVGNKELANELGIPMGSLLPWLKTLRDSRKITAVKRGRYTNHIISLNVIERTLKSVDEKIAGKGR